MAISNNIPMFVDQIASIKRANMELAATGQPVQSAFKQVLGSLLSWQTALSLGVTVLTVYGAEIINFLTGVKETKEELDRLAASQKELNNLREKYLFTEEEIALRNEATDYQKLVEGIKAQAKQYEGMQDVQNLTIENAKKYREALITVNNELRVAEEKHQKMMAEIRQRYAPKQPKVKEVQEKEFKFSGQFDNKVILEANSSLDTMKAKLLELKPIGTDAFISLGGEVNKLGVFFDELGEKIGGWANMAANALAGVGVAFGQALMTGDFDEAGKSIVRQLGNIAVQIGAAMIAIGVPQAAVGLPSGFGYIAGGTALTIVGGAMMASGVAPNSKNSGGGGNDSMGSSMPAFTPDFAASSQYLMLDSRVRGTDIIISADNQRRQNRRIR